MDKGPHGTSEIYLARKNIDSMIKGLIVEQDDLLVPAGASNHRQIVN